MCHKYTNAGSMLKGYSVSDFSFVKFRDPKYLAIIYQLVVLPLLELCAPRHDIFWSYLAYWLLSLDW